MLVLSVLLRQMRIRLRQSPPNIELRRTLRLQPSPPLPYIQSAPACRGLLVASSFLLLRQNQSLHALALSAYLLGHSSAFSLCVHDVNSGFWVNAAEHEEYPGQDLHFTASLELGQLPRLIADQPSLFRLGRLLRGIVLV